MLHQFRFIFLAAFVLIGFLANAQNTKSEPLADKKIIKTFIQQNLACDKVISQQNLKGKVAVHFVIDKDGMCKDYKVTSSLNPHADSVALDLIKKILWKPSTRYLVPIDSETDYAIDFDSKAVKHYRDKESYFEIPQSDLECDNSYKIYERNHLDDLAYPYFSDSTMNLNLYFTKNMIYPESAMTSSLQGTVILSFIVETNGILSNIAVKQSLGGGCDNEAIRLLENTRWIPALKNNKRVRSRVNQQVIFQFGHSNFIDGNKY